jgi:hypothetical protein
VWSTAYDSEPGSMLQFQRELSTAIAEQIRLRLSPDRLAGLAFRRSRDPEAYDRYLRGRHFWNQLTPPTTRRAIESYSKATILDPEYSLAWSGLADAYAAGPITGDVPPLQIWVLRKADGAGQSLASSFNIAAFNLGNAIGAWLGGYVIAGGPGLGQLPWIAALAPLAALALALYAIRFDRLRGEVPAAAE